MGLNAYLILNCIIMHYLYEICYSIPFFHLNSYFNFYILLLQLFFGLFAYSLL